MEQAQNEVSNEGLDIDDILGDDAALKTHKVGITFDDDGEPVTGLLIVGKDSEQYQAIAREIRSSNMMRSSKRKDQIDSSTENGAKKIVNIMVGNELKIAKAVTVGWFGVLSGGQPMPFDKAKADLILEKRPTVRAEVLADLENKANFMKV